MAHIPKYGSTKYGYCITYGTTANLVPVITSSTVANDGYTNASPIQFTVTFNKCIVDNFSLSDIVVSSGAKTNFQAVSGSIFTFDLNTPAQGFTTVNIPAAAAQDGASFDNDPATQYEFNYDSAAPSVAISSSTVSNGGFTLATVINMTATFSEDVTGFTLSDVVVSSGTKSNLVAVSPSVYTFDITLVTGAVVTVDIPSNSVQDDAYSYNTPAPQFSFTFAQTITGSVSGTIVGIQFWTGIVILTGNVIIPSGAEVIIDIAATVYANGYVIVVKDGGYLDTQGKRLPKGSAIGGIIVIT